MKQVFFIIFTFLSCSLFAQKQISGVVTDASTNEALVAVSVLEVGTFNGVYTDFDGSYSISVSDTATQLEFSYMGMKTQFIKISSTTINIELVPDAVLIDAVVVTVPYGKQKKETFTGSMSVLKSDQLHATEGSFDKALQGQVPGVNLSSASGQPGSSTEIQLRGVGSITAGSSPLIVIDGVPVYSGDMSQAGSSTNILSSINQNDIASISVLKDASATSMYGSRASNGVIMITTKSGKEGKTQYSFSTTQGVGLVVKNNFDVLSASEYKTIQAEAMSNAGLSDFEIEQALVGDTANVNWFDEVFQPAYYQSYDFVARGGTEKLKHYFSVSYKDQEGIVDQTGLTQYSVRLNLDNKVSKRVTYGVKLNPSFSLQNNVETPGILSSPVTGVFLAPPTQSILLNSGDYNFENGFYNPLGSINLNQNTSECMRILGNAYVSIELSKDFEFKSIFNVDNISNEELIYRHPETPDGSLVGGIGELFNTTRSSLTSSSTLRWSKSIESKHNISLLGGFEAESSQLFASNMKASNFPFAGITSLQAAAKPEQANTYASESALLSVLSRVQYNYKAKYYASASFRTDGSSKFSAGNRWANFWSLGGSWLINREQFMLSQNTISLLKLRASYGTSGNANIDDYLYYQLYAYGNNYMGSAGLAPSIMGNNDLSWEKNNNLNVGIDIEIRKKYSASIELYNRKTFDLLLDVPVSMTTGYSTQIQNVGGLSNKGLELTISSKNIDKKDFTWTTSATFAMNINTVEELYSEEVKDTIIQGTKIRTEGEALQSFYLPYWAGVNIADGSPLWYDENGEPTSDYNKAVRVIAGSADPKFTAGLQNTFKYKQWTCGFMLYLNYGNLVFNQLNTDLVSDGAIMGKNQSSLILDRWQKPGDNTDVPQVIQNNASGGNEFSTRFLEDGTYLRVKNINLSYSLKNELLAKYKLTSFMLNLQVQNPFVWSKFSGMDPETRSNGVYFYDYPKQRLFTLGVNVGF